MDIHTRRRKQKLLQKKQKLFKQKLQLVSMFAIVAIVCFVLNYKTHKLEDKKAEYNQNIKDLEQDMKTEKQRSKEIENQKAYIQTKQFAEEVARDQLHLVYPDEILFEEED